MLCSNGKSDEQEGIFKVYPVVDVKAILRSYKTFKPTVKNHCYNVKEATAAKKSKVDDFVSNF